MEEMPVLRIATIYQSRQREFILPELLRIEFQAFIQFLITQIKTALIKQM